MGEMRDEDFAHFVRNTRPALRRAAFHLSEDWYEADDLVQRTLMALHRHWDRLERHDKIEAYARTVMKRLIISDRRSLRRSREVLIELLPEPAPAADPYAMVGERMVLMEALAGLGPRQRATVVLRYWEDRSIEETAQAMGSGSSTVRSQAVRALNALRGVLRTGSDGNAEDAQADLLSRPWDRSEIDEVGER
ncbi:SigE family RNA polymerase sigma factor [Planomonospora sp. ID67723]|uniref:SigE family RNA polymerase sigma factor n=1 Tax=Planomonospora sp. ID67723 TaxID=2738134 RepID=UPI0018C3AA1A|nr:SigE family RNA polymerase sigma factor [Planomonospora sp. ID67723]MBG0829067.1 SigE family RNA polymerase sigma factor [Planomonospora sp. ID67723]